MPVFSLVSYLTAGSTLLLALFVFARNRTSRLSNIFVLYSLSIAEWSYFTGLHAATASQETSLFAARAMHLGVPLIPAFFFHFSLDILGLHRRYKRVLVAGYGLAICFIVANFLTDLIVPRVVPKLGYRYFMDGGILYPGLIVYFIGFILFGLWHLFRAYRDSVGNRRNQLKYLFWGSVLGYLFGPSCFLPVYDITIIPYPYGSLAIVVYVMLTAYAIFRYRLMDIRVMAVRAVSFAAVYIPVLILPFLLGQFFKPSLIEWFDGWWWVAPVITANLMAIAGIYVYFRILSGAENALLREQRRYQTSLLQVSQSMTLIKEIDRLLNLIVHVLSKAVRVKNAILFLKDKDSPVYSLRAARYKSCRGIEAVLSAEDVIVLHLMKHRAPIVLDELRVRSQEHADRSAQDDYRRIESKMAGLDAAVIVPSFIHEVLIGFMVLGEKRNGYMYTQDDLNVFAVLANQSALAIENAIFYEERGKSLAEQFHDEKLKSLGKMGSDMSHQVNNRLNIILASATFCGEAILPMLRECLTRNDLAGAVAILANVEQQLKSIESNATRGGEIAQAIMRFARKSADIKLDPVDFQEALNGARLLLSVRFAEDSSEFAADISPSTPKIIANLALLEDVLMNLLSNARDAQSSRIEQMKEGKIEQDPAYKPRIIVRAYRRSDSPMLQIDIEDNGIGMTEHQLNQIFVPFFTTKAGAGKGTGLGLNIIRQMVDHMNGKIEVSSDYGKGTVFTISLPLADEVVVKTKS